MRCLLIGNYGVGNLGDEALREFFLENFPEIEWTVLSSHPSRENEVPRLPCGVRSFFKPWWKTVKAYRQVDAVVLGGGTLFTDIESAYACVLWWWHAYVAKFFKKPIFLAFQGIGPFRTKLGLRLTKWVVKNSVHLSVRDVESYKRVESWGLKKKIIQSFDPVFVVFSNMKVSLEESNTIVLIPRHNSGETFLIEVSKILEEHHGDPVRIVLMQPDHEKFIVSRIKSMVRGRFEVREATTEEALMQSISDALLVVSERYHGALAALALGVPLVVCPMDSGDKLDVLQGLLDTKAQLIQRDHFIQLIGTGFMALREALENEIPR